MLPRLLLFAIALLLATAAIAESEPEAYPLVITPTRLRQSLQDVPASVTIITAETLQRFAVTSVVDALRLVPGMAIVEPSGGDYRINYHGTNVLSPRRMNVLIDGLSVYQPAYARVDWVKLPVAIEDIDRIEVTRGPASAAYGPNSMLAVVNIITKHPQDVEPSLIAMTAGPLEGTLNLTGRLGGTSDSTNYRITIDHQRDGGYDSLLRIANDHDSSHVSRINMRSVTALDAGRSFDLSAGYTGAVKEVPFAEQYQTSFPDQRVEDYYVNALFGVSLADNHEVQLRASYWDTRLVQSWNTCMPTVFWMPEMFALWQANPTYARAILARQMPSGGSPQDDVLAAAALAAIAQLGSAALAPTCLTPNQDIKESRLDVEVQDTYVASQQVRMVVGLGLRQEIGNSQTFFGGKITNSSARFFGNVEYRPRDAVSVNAGVYAEQDRLSNRSSVSPRVAANFQLSDTSTFRAIWSQGSRTPDLFERRAMWTYSVDNANPPLAGQTDLRFFQSAQGSDDLTSERITSREVGYLLKVPSYGAMVDIKVFDDRLTDLISEKLQVADFQPTNRGSVHLSGAELQANVDLVPDWTGFLSYAYLANDMGSIVNERSQYARHSGAIGIHHSIGGGLSWSVAYYGSSADGPNQNSFGRTDVVVSKTDPLEAGRLSTAFIIRRLDNKAVQSFRDVNSASEGQYSNGVAMLFQVRASF